MQYKFFKVTMRTTSPTFSHVDIEWTTRYPHHPPPDDDDDDDDDVVSFGDDVGGGGGGRGGGGENDKGARRGVVAVVVPNPVANPAGNIRHEYGNKIRHNEYVLIGNIS